MGGRVAAWLGAVIVTIGMGVFLKYAWDQGWLKGLGPGARMVAACTVGVLLVAAGELTIRRLGRAAAAGLMAAGLGTLYVTAAVATAPTLMPVYGPLEAAVHCLVVCIAGAVLARRSGLVVVSLASVAGPVLAGAWAGVLAPADTLAAPAYLSMVLAVSLVLASTAPGGIAARWLALILVAGGGLHWLVDSQVPWPWRHGTVGLWWCLVTAQCVVMAWRGRMGRSNVAVALAATGLSAWWWSSNAGFFGATRDPAAWFAAAQALLLGALAAQLHASTAGTAPTPLRRLSAAFGFLAAAMAALAVSLLTGPRSAVTAWLLMGVAGALVGIRGRMRGVVAGAAVILTLAAGGSWVLLLVERLAVGGWPEWFVPRMPGLMMWHPQGWWLPPVTALAALGLSRVVRGRDEVGGWRTDAVAAVMIGAAALAWCGGAAVLAPPWTGVLLAAIGVIAGAGVMSVRPVNPPDRWWAPVCIGLLVALCPVLRFVELGVSGLQPEAAVARTLSIVGIAGGLVLLSAMRLVALPPARAAGAAAALVLFSVIVDLTAGRGVRADAGECNQVAIAATLAAVGAAALGVTLRRPWGAAACAGLAAWAAVLWLYGCGVLGTAGGGPSGLPMSNTTNATAAVVLAGLTVGLWCRPGAALAGLLACLLVGVLLTAGTQDLHRLVRGMDLTAGQAVTLRAAAVSLFWALLGAIAVVGGFWMRLPAPRWMGLLLLALTATKVLLFDMQGAATLWRVAALLGVGLLLVATSLIYGAVERRLRRTEAA